MVNELIFFMCVCSFDSENAVSRRNAVIGYSFASEDVAISCGSTSTPRILHAQSRGLMLFKEVAQRRFIWEKGCVKSI